MREVCTDNRARAREGGCDRCRGSRRSEQQTGLTRGSVPINNKPFNPLWHGRGTQQAFLDTVRLRAPRLCAVALTRLSFYCTPLCLWQVYQ